MQDLFEARYYLWQPVAGLFQALARAQGGLGPAAFFDLLRLAISSRFYFYTESCVSTEAIRGGCCGLLSRLRFAVAKPLQLVPQFGFEIMLRSLSLCVISSE